MTCSLRHLMGLESRYYVSRFQIEYKADFFEFIMLANCIYMCMYICIYTYMYTCIHICIHSYIHIHIWTIRQRDRFDKCDSIDCCLKFCKVGSLPIVMYKMIGDLSVESTGWQRCIGCLKLQVSFRKRAVNYMALLQSMTNKDKASYASSPPCNMTRTLELKDMMQSNYFASDSFVAVEVVADTLQHSATLCNTRLHNTPHCNILQHSATHGNTLQHSATPCNTLQHTERQLCCYWGSCGHIRSYVFIRIYIYMHIYV